MKILRVLETGKPEQVIGPDLVLYQHDLGYRVVMRGDTLVCTDADEEKAFIFNQASAARVAFPQGGTVALIGGGFCLFCQLFEPTFRFTIFELEPALQQFAPATALFVPGDWNVTLQGLFDVIVYDLPSDVPRGTLSGFLKPGGIILPEGEPKP